MRLTIACKQPPVAYARSRGADRTQMKRTWTIIGVGDVAGSCKWYQSLLGQPETPPAHDDFGQILDSDGTVLLCLHEWGAHEHPSLMSPDQGKPGNGLLLFFRVDDFDMALQGHTRSSLRLEEEPHMNPTQGPWSSRSEFGRYTSRSVHLSAEQGAPPDRGHEPAQAKRSVRPCRGG